jgi:hypothetical protein
MDLDEWDELEEAEKEKYLAYPLGLLRHSGDVVYVGNKGHWADPGSWDSGCMGIAYITKKQALKEWGGAWKNGNRVKTGTRLTKKVRDAAFESLKAEVAEMNLFLQGDVYGVVVTNLETEEEDSCWGFYCAGGDDIRRCVKEMLPAGMPKEAKTELLNELDWE